MKIELGFSTTAGATPTGGGFKKKYKPNEKLPDRDLLNSISNEPGIYDLDRWPLAAKHQQQFLKRVIELWGPTVKVQFFEPDDGYPGYIKISK